MNLYTFFSILIFTSCNIGENNIIETNLPVSSPRHEPCEPIDNTSRPTLLWKSEFIDQALAASMNPVVYKNQVIISRSADFNSPDELICYDIHTGEKKWEWYDYFTPGEGVTNGPYFVEDDIFHLCTYGSLYFVNLNAGNSVFKKNFGTLNACGSYGEGNLVTMSYSTPVTKEVSVFNKNDNSVIPLLSIPKSSDYNGSFSTPIINGNSFYFSFNSYSFLTNSNSSVLYKVNVEGDSSVLKWKITIPGKGGIGKSGYRFLGNRLYVVDRALYCIDTRDGSILWKQPDIYGGPAGLIIADNKLIVASNHINPSLFAFDLFTGEILWKEPFRGTASPLQFHNCVIYSVCGGDGMLHAVDINTGRHLYKMDSPDYAQNSNLFFDNCAVDKATNSLLLTNYKYLLRYKLPDY